MAKKVVLEPADFEKIVIYIKLQPVNFQNADKAVIVGEALNRAQLMDITIKEDKKPLNSKLKVKAQE